LPTDVTGASIFNPKTTEFEFRPGPIFAQIVLADEINRATPRTQSALLEAMAESRVTVDGTTYALKPPFLVIGTQNPIDHEGTFPLPEAQLDRFLMRFSLGYPSLEHELKMLEILEQEHPLNKLTAVVTAADLVAAQRGVRAVHVDHYQDARARRPGAGGQPACVDRPVPHFAGDGGHSGPRLRPTRRREARGAQRA
jgi:MoxR-like ATPase